MNTKTIRNRPLDKSETIFEYEARLKQEAKAISKSFIDKKPIKYLIK
jgi:hypothetical protein